MTSDPDIFRAAKLVIDQHSEEAANSTRVLCPVVTLLRCLFPGFG